MKTATTPNMHTTTARRASFAVVALCLAATAGAAEEVHRTVEASPNGTVTISNTSGSIDVRGWSRNQVDVRAELGRNVEELIVERDGDEVLVKVKHPRGKHRHIGSTEMVVQVPEGSRIRVTGVSADIEVENVQGEQRLSTVSGDIETQAFRGDLTIEAVSGDVTVHGHGHDVRLRANSVSGDVEIADVSGELEAVSVSGDIAIHNGSFERATLHTTNGDMDFEAHLRPGGRMDVETINGDVGINFQNGISARFDIETFNGGVHNCFGPKAERTSRYAPGMELVFSEGGGAGQVTIRTLNGDLRMCKD